MSLSASMTCVVQASSAGAWESVWERVGKRGGGLLPSAPAAAQGTAAPASR